MFYDRFYELVKLSNPRYSACSPLLIVTNPALGERGLQQWGKGKRILPNREAREEQKVRFFGI